MDPSGFRPNRRNGAYRHPVAYLAVSKRTIALAVALALVIGGAAGFAWHAPGSSGTWADIRGWVGFAVVVIGVVIALVQLDLQRRQLAEQHKTIQGEVERNKQRDALMAGQLKELEQRAVTFERQQADEVDIRQSSALQRFPDPVSGLEYRAYLAEVTNHSRRPIRNVVCRIESGPGHGLGSSPGHSLAVAHRVGLYAYTEVAAASSSPASPTRELPKLAEGTDRLLIRAGEAGVFVFAVNMMKHPKARITTRFTDDAGLHWQIDPDLHIKKLPNRDDW